MCRSIVTLRGEEAATSDEVRSAAVQYVRKISGYTKPSKANEAVFEQAVAEVAVATQRLLDGLVTPPGARPPAMARSRIVAREKAAPGPVPSDCTGARCGSPATLPPARRYPRISVDTARRESVSGWATGSVAEKTQTRHRICVS